ncbi:MAG: ATP-binding protein [Patescibacteria group bacterium]|nr:ATP-binding protein [Patescibacteria group bacterium]
MSWFEVSKEGLRQLQLGKPKHYVVRELVQNAWDEDTKICRLEMNYSGNTAMISIEDDSPEGFRDIRDAFTLFAPTYKRKDPTKRGRFNIGEKQALSICDLALIETTKGTVRFNDKGRTETKDKREVGSKVTVSLKMTKAEFDECIDVARNYLVPSKLKFYVNSEEIKYRKIHKAFITQLQTEIEVDGALKKTYRITTVDILKTEGKSYLYEMGIPVMEIDCDYDIDVQQKIPLSSDRDTVSTSYLSTLYAGVLNATFEEIDEENCSDEWIIEATANKKISSDAIIAIMDKRYGEKRVVANPFDPNSVDDAISAGYKVISGRELSKEVWENIRKAGAIVSSTELFGNKTTSSERYEPNEDMKEVAVLAKKIAKACLGITIDVSFAKWDGATSAQYGNRQLSFNVKNLGTSFFSPSLSTDTLDIIVHELAHEKGHHTEKSYLDTITRMAGELVTIALEEPEFFK